MDQQVLNSLLGSSKVVDYLLKMKSEFSGIINELPICSGYVIFQINQSMDELYIGFC